MAERRLALTSLPGFADDVHALPDLRTRKMALDMLVFVRDGRVRGVLLGQHSQIGDLSDCYKLYFDPDGSQKPRFRLVYRFTPNEIEAVAVEAVAVGELRNLGAYREAARRLDRVPGGS